MSEQSMGEAAMNPRSRAIAYLEMKQSGKFQGGREKNIKTPKIPEKVRRAAPLVETVEAYEQMIDKMGQKGFEGSQKMLADLRPAAYEAAQAVQFGARLADIALTTIIIPFGIKGRGRFEVPLKISGMWATMRYRPVEWAVGKMAKIGGAVVTSEAVAPIVNKILHGGERVKPGEPAPVAV